MFTVTSTSAANPLDVPYFEQSYDTLVEAIGATRNALMLAQQSHFPDYIPQVNNRPGEVLGIDLVGFEDGQPLEHLAVVRAE
jgi:hypothetical protein